MCIRDSPDDDDPPEEQGAVDKGNLIKVVDSTNIVLEWLEAVSYTHLTLPTIYSV